MTRRVLVREEISEAGVDLLRSRWGALLREHLVSAVVPFESAAQLLIELADRKRQELQVILSV